MEQISTAANGAYICVRALEDGVNIIGMTRGRETRLQHTEILNEGEVLIAQFTDNISAMKVRGKAVIYTANGQVPCGR